MFGFIKRLFNSEPKKDLSVPEPETTYAYAKRTSRKTRSKMHEHKQCSECNEIVPYGGSHTCSRLNNRVIEYDDNNFMMSYLIASATDSAALGYLGGGSIAGAMLGDISNDSNDSNESPGSSGDYNSDSNDNSNDHYDSSSDSSDSSYDSDSSSDSYDSGDCGGCDSSSD